MRRTIVLPGDLAEPLGAEAGRRGISLSDLLAEYAEQGAAPGPIALHASHQGLPAVPATPVSAAGAPDEAHLHTPADQGAATERNPTSRSACCQIAE